MAMGAAALPWIIGAGTAASGVGSVLSAKSSKAQNIPTTAPNPLFPIANAQYGQSIGGAGATGLNSLTSMAQTGEPSDVGGVFNTLIQAQQRMMGQGRANLREQFGGMGLIGSTNFRDAAVDLESQTNKDFANILAQLALQSSESAAQRRMAAGSQLAELFGNTAMAYTPSSTTVGGTPSPVGAGFGSVGNSLTTLALLQAAGMLGKAA